MATELATGDQAPDFDLTSTEGVVLALRDEVPRSRVLLYCFGAVDTAEADLRELTRRAGELGASAVKIIGVSPAPLDELMATQQELALPFPLLHDDRGLSKAYGTDGEGAAVAALIDRDRRVAWISGHHLDLAGALASIAKDRSAGRRAMANYPRSVINRLVDRWVN